MSQRVELQVIEVPNRLNWGWHVKILETSVQPNANLNMAPMMWWCEHQWGARGHQWDRAAHNLLFHSREQAMMFKLAWQNVELQ
jgi:hypothetical protein